MSQINVDIVAPQTGTTVTVNGVKTKATTNTIGLVTDSTPANLTSTFSVVLGHFAAPNATGTQNVIVGSGAAQALSSGTSNTFVGASAGEYITTGFGNSIFGNAAGTKLTTGTGNTYIGYGVQNAWAASAGITGSSCTVIGNGASSSSITVNNEFTLGSSGVSALRCAQTSITSLSDARDKKDITDLRAGLDFVKSLRPVEFVWDERDEQGRHDINDCGFIAQDLKASQEDAQMADVLKLVYESNPEKLEASYGRLIPVLVKAIQELTAKVETLETKKK